MIKLIETASYSYSKDKNKDNQDSILPPKRLNDGLIFAVADGVGSYNGGKEASMFAIDYLNHLTSKDEILNQGSFSICQKIRDKIKNLSEREHLYQQAATTLTYCFVNSNGLTIGHIGDCRLYLRDSHRLVQITKDHTQFQQLIDEKLFTKKYLQDKKAKSILTTAISLNVEMKVDHIFIPVDDLPLENGKMSIYIMSDGSHKFWDRRPRFSLNTMSNTPKFVSSMKQRIERLIPTDDYSLVGVTIEFIKN